MKTFLRILSWIGMGITGFLGIWVLIGAFFIDKTFGFGTTVKDILKMCKGEKSYMETVTKWDKAA